MPKVIENIRETIIQTAKNTLLSEGYDSLSLRRVAKQCNIAVGTIYNYFTSKLTLIVAIMLEDWTELIKKIQKSCTNAESAEAGIKCIFLNLREFALIYQDVWNISIQSNEIRTEMLNSRSRRQMLIEQIASVIGTLLDGFDIAYHSFIPHFIANSLLTYLLEPDFDYEQLNKVFIRILYAE